MVNDCFLLERKELMNTTYSVIRPVEIRFES